MNEELLAQEKRVKTLLIFAAIMLVASLGFFFVQAQWKKEIAQNVAFLRNNEVVYDTPDSGDSDQVDSDDVNSSSDSVVSITRARTEDNRDARGRFLPKNSGQDGAWHRTEGDGSRVRHRPEELSPTVQTSEAQGQPDSETE